MFSKKMFIILFIYINKIVLSIIYFIKSSISSMPTGATVHNN